jgi:hypothetical protein
MMSDIRLFFAPIVGGLRGAREEIHRELAKRPIKLED